MTTIAAGIATTIIAVIVLVIVLIILGTTRMMAFFRPLQYVTSAEDGQVGSLFVKLQRQLHEERFEGSDDFSTA